MAEATKATSSQEIIDAFWKSSLVPEKPPTKATAILPPDVLGKRASRKSPRGPATAEVATKSYESARKECVAKVAKIVRECRRVNEKYSDPYFDLNKPLDCLSALSSTLSSDSSDSSDAPLSGEYNLVQGEATAGRIELYANDTSSESPDSSSFPYIPPSVKRVADIFDNPSFFVEGASAKDIRQGMEGDCWFLSALAALCNLETGEHLLEKVCPTDARDPEVGVYGFLLFRDGEWISVVIDDKLYLKQPDYDASDRQVKNLWEQSKVRYQAQEEYRKAFQSNSSALYYASSTHPDETWVPLLEKAFAKAHGDYGSISGGAVGEGVEDLTGGISVTIEPSNILSKDKFWNEGLLHVNKDFLFGLGTQEWGPDPENKGSDGIQGGHAYSVLRAVNYGKERLVMLKNPWGDHEWNGPWSDGSSQWTAQAIQDLNYTFGDDGVFWMRFEDMLRKYNIIWRTRLFSSEWNVTNQWTQAVVPWAGETRDPRFRVAISQNAPTVIVLSQLDDRYFRGLSGQYIFRLSFRLYKEGEEEHLLRTLSEDWWNRSISVEVDLEAGNYEVRLHVFAQRTSGDKAEDVVKSNWLDRTEKLLRVGASYDFAHTKGQPLEEEQLNETPSDAVNGVEKKDESKESATAPAVDPAPVPAKAEDNAAAEAKQPAKPEASSSTTLPPEPSTESNHVGASPGTVVGDAETARAAVNAGDVDLAPNEKSGAADTAAEETPKDVEDAAAAAVDPWGAVCVVGLRVYCKNASATVEVVKSKKGGAPKPNLDVDNPSRDVANSSA